MVELNLNNDMLFEFLKYLYQFLSYCIFSAQILAPFLPGTPADDSVKNLQILMVKFFCENLSEETDFMLMCWYYIGW